MADSSPHASTAGQAARPSFAEGQVITVFRSRRRPGIEDEYRELSSEILAAARAAPGFVDFKVFVADDGEQVSIITFDSEESHRAWREDRRHRAAQARGRAAIYAEYSIQTGPAVRVRTFP